jgi:Flp pilus assembly protein TadD
MPLRCPVCKAENAGGPACRRCKADLSMLFALEDDRAALLARARQQVASGGAAEAVRVAARANGLHEDEESLRLLALASMLQRDHHEAWRAYRRLMKWHG